MLHLHSSSVARSRALLAICALTAAAAMGTRLMPAAATSPASSRASAPTLSRAMPPSRPLPMVSFAPLVEKTLPAVVSVLVVGETPVPVVLTPGQPVPESSKRPFRSGGSGVIVDAALGLIATNHHVVKDAISIMIRLHDGRETPARLLGVDSGADIAMLKIDLPGLTAIPFGNSSDLRVGDFVIAIGNPFGLEGSATAGIISGLMRSDIGYDIYESFIQIDAAVNPGNSGGALVNIDGELIGLNTAVGRQGAGSVGIAFAIPINMARRIGIQIYKHGRMRRGSLGLQTQDISPAVAEARKLANRRGALITAVAVGSPAARAGIRPGSIILAINGEFVRNNSDYMAHFGSSAVGEEVTFQLLKGNLVETIKLMVSDQEAEPTPVTIFKDVKVLGGLTVSDISSRSPLYGQLRGAVVKGAEPSSPASASGLMPHDIIVSVDRTTISGASQIVDLALADTPLEQVKINRQGTVYIVKLRPD